MNSLFSLLKETCAVYQIRSLDRQMDAVDHLLSLNKVIDVAVLGQFKAGKSSFLNGFMGRDILPMGVIPLTSVITRITYGSEDAARVTFFDGNVETVEINNIDQYVSEAKNPENKKGVLWVDIELPELAPYQGLRFVDTPGLGSIFRHNSEVTEKWAPEIGVAIIAISADRPLSEGEILLIKEAEKYSPNIVVLLTKADLFDQSQINEIVDFVSQSLVKSFNHDIPIYRFSAKRDTEKYRDTLISKLFMPLKSNFGTEFEKIVRYKIHSLAQGCLSYLELSLEVSKRTDVERENLKSILLGERLSIDYVRNELLLVTTSLLGRTRDRIFDVVSPYRHKLTPSIVGMFADEYVSWHGNLFKVSRRYEKWLEGVLRREIKKIVNEERRNFIELIDEAHRHFSFFCRSFRDRLNQGIRAVLGIEIKSEEWVVEIKEIRDPDVRISRASEFHLDMFWFLFPMVIFRGIFGRHFRSQIPYEIKKNLHRITSDLTEIVNKRIEDLKDQTYRFISNELATVESILNAEKSDTDELQRIIVDLKQRLDGD
jgi:GTP-binding protein EngB required for normal cell division